MPSRRTIKGVLHNFLGTFTSRYSDFDGYWVFGFLVKDIDGMRIDLLETIAEETAAAPLVFARRLAAQRFLEQISKAHLPKCWFNTAQLRISQAPQGKLGIVNRWRSSGVDYKFEAQAVTDLGKMYVSTTTIFVAPHNPNVELRSNRAT